MALNPNYLGRCRNRSLSVWEAVGRIKWTFDYWLPHTVTLLA
jgi:hypothetical protein